MLLFGSCCCCCLLVVVVSFSFVLDLFLFRGEGVNLF